MNYHIFTETKNHATDLRNSNEKKPTKEHSTDHSTE